MLLTALISRLCSFYQLSSASITGNILLIARAWCFYGAWTGMRLRISTIKELQALNFSMPSCFLEE